jgi:hypothetical protein
MYKGEYDHELFSTYVSPEEQIRRAAELAENREIEQEVQRLRKGTDSVFYRLFRVAVRLGRILIGGGMFVGVYVFVVDGPFAALVRVPMSFGSFFALLFCLVFFGALFVVAGKIAFGEPPSDQALWSDARRNVLDRAGDQIKKARVAVAYRKSKVWGLLTDPDVGSLAAIGFVPLYFLTLMFFAVL